MSSKYKMTNYTKEDESRHWNYEGIFDTKNITSAFLDSDDYCNSSLFEEVKNKTVWFCIHSNTSKCYLSPKVLFNQIKSCRQRIIYHLLTEL